LKELRDISGEGELTDFQIRMSIASRLDQVWPVRIALAAILREMDVTDLDCLHVQLALAEAINNCIEHGYGERREGLIEIAAEAKEDKLRIEITDDAPPLPLPRLEELLRKPMPEPSETAPLAASGRGLPIMRSTMDSVTFGRSGERNRLVLCKTLRRMARGR
jgi:anti-sigma regulatory factor (Ser/Thr protein kinase)